MSGSKNVLDEIEEEADDIRVTDAPEVDEDAKLRQEYEALKAEREADKRRVAEANRLARTSQERVREAEMAQVQNQRAMVDHAIMAARAEADAAEQNYAVAMANGDFAAAAKAQREMTRAENKLGQLEFGKAQLEQHVARTPAQNNGISKRSQQWLDAHPEVMEDPSLKKRVVGLHHRAIYEEDLQPDTDEYFEFIENNMRPKPRRATPDDESENTETRPAPKKAVSAPVSRANPSGRVTEVALTAAEKEIAAELGMSAKQYAANKEKIRSGKTRLRWSPAGPSGE